MRDLRDQLTEQEAAEIKPNLCGQHPDLRDVVCRDCIALFTLRSMLQMREKYGEMVRASFEETHPRLIKRKPGRRPGGLPA